MNFAGNKVAFTGTRRGMSIDQMHAFPPLVTGVAVFNHGDAIGADFNAHQLAKSEVLYICIHPCTLTAQRAFCQGAHEVRAPLPPLTRDFIMVDESELLIATPRSRFMEMQGSGTWATMRYAKRKKKSVIVIWPDGQVEEWCP